jgi:two-component system NtrC family sensor kinase
MPAILYVDDETPLRRAVQAWLGHHGVEVFTARSVEGALRCLERQRVDGVFVDLWLADGSGFELYAYLEEHDKALARKVVFITGDIVPSETTTAQLDMIGCPVLFKPFDLSELDRYVRLWRDASPGATAPTRAESRGEPNADAPAEPRLDARADAHPDMPVDERPEAGGQ